MRAPGRILSLLVCLGLAAVAPAPALAAATKAPKQKRQTACQRLQANNRDESPDRRLVLVTRGDDEYGTIYACVLPRGKLRRLVTWDDGLGRESQSVAGTAGTWVLVASGWGDQYGGVSSTLTRFDVRSGRAVALASYGCNVMFERECTSGTSYGAFAIAASGAGAIELTDLATRARTLQAFSPAGRLTVLGDAPVQTLRVRGSEVLWTRDGVEFRAPLPA